MDESLVMTFDHFPTRGIVHFSILLFPHFSCQMPNFFELSVDENELKKGIRTGWELLAGLPADESEYFKRTSGAITSVPLAMVHRERMQCAPPKESLRHLLNGRQVPRDVLRHDTHPVAAQSPAQTAALTSPPPFSHDICHLSALQGVHGFSPGVRRFKSRLIGILLFLKLPCFGDTRAVWGRVLGTSGHTCRACSLFAVYPWVGSCDGGTDNTTFRFRKCSQTQ